MHTVRDGPNQMLNNVLLLLRTNLTAFQCISKVWPIFFIFYFSFRPGQSRIPTSPGLTCSSLDFIWNRLGSDVKSSSNYMKFSIKNAWHNFSNLVQWKSTVLDLSLSKILRTTVTGALLAQKVWRAASHSTCAAYCKGSPTVQIFHLSTFWLGYIPHTDTHRHTDTKEGTQLRTTDGQISKKPHSITSPTPLNPTEKSCSRTHTIYVTHTHFINVLLLII